VLTYSIIVVDCGHLGEFGELVILVSSAAVMAAVFITTTGYPISINTFICTCYVSLVQEVSCTRYIVSIQHIDF